MGLMDDFLTGGQGAANEFNAGLMGQMQGLFGQARDELRLGSVRGRGDLLRALLSLKEGKEKAGAEVGRLGDAARTDILANQEAAGGQIEQGMISSGFSGSSVGAGLKRGLASDTSRALGNVDTQLAQMFSDLEMRLASGLAQGQTNMANLESGTSQGLASLFSGEGMNLSNFLAKGGQSGLSMLADIGGVATGFKGLLGGGGD